MRHYLPINPDRSKLLSIVFLLQNIIFSFSCENEKHDSLHKTQLTENEIEIKDGRLYFQSKESFSQYYHKYVSLPEEELSDLLTPFYKKGFLSLKPIVTEKNEEMLFNLYKEKLNLQVPRGTTSKNTLVNSSVESSVNADPFESVDELIGDETFAAYLNIDGEIQIGESIYKYTDVGLFIADKTVYTTLKNFLISKNISENPFSKTELTVKENLIPSLPEDFPTPIGNNIIYYRPSDSASTNSKSTSISSKSGKLTSSDPNYNTFFNSLNSCNPNRSLFGNLFGDNDVCIDQYERKRRVKTKAFNYDYLLVFHLGVKCVHQFRGWTGFWRVEATDEIRLVVEAAQFEYDRDKLLGNNVINNQTKERAYFMNDKRAFFTGPNNINIYNEWGQPVISYVNLNSLPKIFQDDLTFEFFGTGSSSLDNLIQNGIDSNLKASKLNEWFYSGLYSTAKSQLQTAFGSSTVPPENRTFAAKFPENGKIIVQKSISSQGYDIGVREKTFDWGVKFCFNNGNGSSWSIQPNMGCEIITKPSNFRVKIIGAARKGNEWHGSKFNADID
ncbi:hypothetical protein QQY79_06125 [Flavobacterium tructae]|uniref:hypothetical protein n=1 Tax=Flavobacterium tructae TaxID=1114873 RepID=UPI0025520469|nr:hypothetical protein [Flavobacterium tructae]MDL2142091.1 hypothetical protein [Flavobacterium tructae]